MKKSILNLGKALSKDQQAKINGGFPCTFEVCEVGRKGHWIFDPGCDCDVF